MEIPKNIKVGGITYNVELVEYLPHEEAGNKWGECDYQHSTIKIWKGLSLEKQGQTFIHELTHAIAHEAGIDDQDEDLINRFALVAYQVVKENVESLCKAIGSDVSGDLLIDGNAVCSHGIRSDSRCMFCKNEKQQAVHI